MNWRSVKDAFPYAMYLTYHEDDLYPVCGFMNDLGVWIRITEGPEDEIVPNSGNCVRLLRSPTHILDLEDLSLPIKCPMEDDPYWDFSPEQKQGMI